MAKNPQTGLNDTGVTRSMTWGPDLSGTEQGAGGLLWTFDDNDDGVIPGYDGNGNIIAWLDISDGSLAGTREYGAFGEDVTFTGVAHEIPFGFSTKYQDSLSGLYYYGYRYYDASTGRWLNRDPLEDQGGINLYAFVGNNAIDLFDSFGLKSWKERDPLNIAMRGALILGMGFDGAGTIDEGADISFSSLSIGQATRHIEKYFDINRDGKLDWKDCPPFKLGSAKGVRRLNAERRDCLHWGQPIRFNEEMIAPAYSHPCCFWFSNLLNQYTEREYPGALDARGVADAGFTVEVERKTCQAAEC